MNKNRNRAGRGGSRSDVSQQGRSLHSMSTGTQPVEPTSPDELSDGSIGLSISIGHSTEFAREKFEVAAWLTLPCPGGEADADTRQEMFDICKEEVTSEVARLRDEIVDKFFPHIMDEK